MCNDQKFIAKLNALKEWCKSNGFAIQLADQDFLTSHPFSTNLEDFDPKTFKKNTKII